MTRLGNEGCYVNRLDPRIGTIGFVCATALVCILVAVFWLGAKLLLNIDSEIRFTLSRHSPVVLPREGLLNESHCGAVPAQASYDTWYLIRHERLAANYNRCTWAVCSLDLLLKDLLQAHHLTYGDVRLDAALSSCSVVAIGLPSYPLTSP